MKRITPLIILSALVWGATTTTPAQAQDPAQLLQYPVQGVGVSEAQLERHDDRMDVELRVDLRNFELKGNRAVLLTPGIVKGRDTLALHSVGIYSRQRYYYYIRNGNSLLTGPTEEAYRDAQKPSEVLFRETVPYAEWMNGSSLVLMRRDYGCCSALIDRQTGGPLAGYEFRVVPYEPEFRYVRPVAAERKTYSLSGRAYVDFPVNRTEVFPDYRRNRQELAKIIATIDSVRNDKDITVTSLSIKGFASPEGSYSNNERLARGRTEALRQYVQRLYHFEPGFIRTDYEPEDWAGLREYVASSGLMHRDEILFIIDDPMLDPDIKDKRIQARYGDEYRFLLENIYPGLRHSDYRIEYSVRGYSDIEEIRRIMAEAPQKLSLNEMYLLAGSLEPGSDRYNEVFETAVRLFPSDETANLNAANSAMQRGDLVSASRYLERAGNSPEALYAKGIFSALQGNYPQALELVNQAAAKGLAGAAAMADHLQEVME